MYFDVVQQNYIIRYNRTSTRPGRRSLELHPTELSELYYTIWSTTS